MPCRDYEEPLFRKDHSYENLLKQQNDRLARIACAAMTALETIDPNHPALQDQEAAEWWKLHKLNDAASAAKQ